MITPNSTVILCSVPLDKNQEHQLHFSSRSAQSAYFASKAVHTYQNLTFQRPANTIRVPDNLDSLYNVNYVMYNNNLYSSRWFYAFIDKMEWASENTTLIYMVPDVFQTWFIDCTFHPSFIEREHVSDDTIGLHTYPEGLETGEHIRSTAITDADLGACDIIIASTLESDGATPIFGDVYNGIYSGVKYYGSQNPAAIGRFIDAFNTQGKIDAILAIFMCPHKFSGATNATDVVEIAADSLGDIYTITGPSRPATVNGYVPKNNKLFCYPYQYLYVHNNNGNAAAFRFEYFADPPTFSLYGPIMPNPVFKLAPSNTLAYPSTGIDTDGALTIGGFPLCPWASDAYKNWIAQNSGSIMASTAAAVLAIGVGVATAGLGAPIAAAATAKTLASAAALTGGVSLALDQIGNQSEKKAQPPQAQGQINSGSANAAVGWNDFFIYGKTILAEYAERIDNFFSMYGYKVCLVKTPNLSSRPVWNYVKTDGAVITGAIPVEDMDSLKAIFNRGVTLWHDPAHFGDYTQDNAIVAP